MSVSRCLGSVAAAWTGSSLADVWPHTAGIWSNHSTGGQSST